MSKKKVKNKTDQQTAKNKLWELGVLDWKLTPVQKTIKHGILNDTNKTSVVLCSRRLGKCRAEGSLVSTPSGFVKIEDLKPGDTVYGYERDGSVKPTKVVAVEYQGEKEVVDLVNHGKVLDTCTPDHRWLLHKERNSLHYQVNEFVEKSVKDRKSDELIVRKFVKAPLGDVYEPHAYALGALIGDGCSRNSKADFKIDISSENEIIPKKVAEVLGAEHYYKQCDSNHTWTISNNEKKEFRGYSSPNRPKLECHHYKDWCKEKYAHEKTVNLEVIKTWDRESCLQFMAGLIDTDGSVRTANNKEIVISFGCQSKSAVEAFSYLFHVLFQYKSPVIQEKRDKYKNGPMFYVSVKNNLFTKMALKELSPYIQTPRKKYKEEYDSYLENNSNRDKVGFKIENKRIARCWDIQVDNETSLYLTDLGLVTHNSYLMCTMALEQCLSLPGSVVKFVFPKAKDTKRNILPLMRQILEDCPPEFKPRYMEADKEMRFTNGSTIQFAGNDAGNIEGIRGGYAHLCIFDEVGFASDDVTYSIRSVLSPTTKTTGGRIVLVSTPPRSANHEFQTDWIDPYKAEGRVKVFTLYDNPNFTPEIIEEILSEFPDREEDPQFRREYLCESVRDVDKCILPSLTEKKEKIIVTDQYERPPYCDRYVALDIGGVDLTAVLFGYYDYERATLVVEREFVCDGTTNSSILADKIKEIEKELWTNPIDKSVLTPYMRISDNNNKILLTDLQKLHGLSFSCTKKDNKQAAINSLDVAIQQERLIIHPSCVHTVYHAKYAEWNNAGTSFKHMKDSPSGKIRGGHADALDALLYMHRSVVKSHNPFPQGYGMNVTGNDFQGIRSPKPSHSSLGDALSKLFKKK